MPKLALLLLSLLAPPAPAGEPHKLDPLCDTSVDFQKELAHATTLHRKFPQYRAITGAQAKWFSAVRKDMVETCLADKKFAEEIVKREKASLSGQCKPAGEAALYDKEILTHAEQRLKGLQEKRNAFLLKGGSGQESLAAIFLRNHELVDDDALDIQDSPRETACELQWLYPKAMLKTKIPFVGCAEGPGGSRIDQADKADPGVFARLITRYSRSIDYNTERRNTARKAAAASTARYEECIAKFPGTENTLTRALSSSAQGSAAAGKNTGPGAKTRESTITGEIKDVKE